MFRVWGENDSFLVLTVVGPVPEELPFTSKDSEKIRNRLFRIGHAFVNDATHLLAERLPEHSIEGKVLNGLAAEVICKVAFAWNADLIIMGSHGRQGFPHFILGSVAEEVIRKSPCSVEVVKEKRQFVPKSGSEKSKSKLPG